MWKTALQALLPSGKLLLRLVIDGRVPGKTRALAAGAVAYALLPIDVIPDSIPLLGKVDDLALIALALVRLVRDAGPELVREHWDGDAEGLEAFQRAIDLLDSLVPPRVRRLAGLAES